MGSQNKQIYRSNYRKSNCFKISIIELEEGTKFCYSRNLWMRILRDWKDY
ncbi:unnamed protein product [Paramecium sonneborni]|uniref:Uncharacterized protein n=1 Tax=Paramecium sonneborni TaxID=65129 RepID=A0A8S1NCJ8_9CILI|nr:unnamed protein product [Paramecium sonneborni]